MKRKFIFLLVCLPVIVLLGHEPVDASVRTEKGQYVVEGAEGHAVIRNGNKATARDEALKMAYRDAVDKAASECAPGISGNRNYSAMKDRLNAKALSLVKNFKVTGEEVRGDEIYITGSCNVSEKSFDGVLGPEVISMLGNPRVMIIVDETVGGKAPFISTVETELLQQFEKAGYLIVDKEQAEVLLSLDPSKAFGDPSLLANAAKTLKADVIVLARANAGASAHAQRYGINMYKVSGQVQVKAVLTKTAYQITTTTYSGGSGKNWVGSPTSGVGGIFKNGASRAANELIYKIAYKMAAGSAIPGMTVNVKLAGASYSDLAKIKERLLDMEGDSGEVFVRSFENGLLELDVISGKNADGIAAYLADFVEVNGMTAQTVSARVRPQISGGSVAVSKDTPAPGKVIDIQIGNVRDFKDTVPIEKALRDFIGQSGKVSGSYEGTVYDVSITYPEGAEDIKSTHDIVQVLEGIKIRIDGAGEKFIKGWRKGGWLW